MIKVLEVPPGELDQYLDFVKLHGYDVRPPGETILMQYMRVYHPEQKKIGDY